MRRHWVRISVAAALLCGGLVAAGLLARSWPLGRLPMWDAAGNGWNAVELWAALSHRHLLDFLVRLNAQDTWPFGFSLLMLPFVVLGGSSFESATLLPAVAFALVPPLLVWAGWEIERQARGLAAGLVAGALWLASPLPRALATVAMRETTGAALGVAAIAAYLRARRRGSLAAWRWAGGALLALFLVKANYFFLTAGGLALHAALALDRGRLREVATRLGLGLVEDGWRSPARWLALLAAVSVVLFGLGQNPGTLLYGGLVVATIVIVARRRAWLRRPRAALARLSVPSRALVETLVVPCWIWFLSPAPVHPRNLIAFLRNRPAEQPLLSADALAFYPLSLFNDFFASPWLAWPVAAFALAALVLLLRPSDRARAAALCAFVGSLALVGHPYKQARFLATVAPLVFLVAALVAARGAAAILPLGGARRQVLGVVVGLLALGGIASTFGIEARQQRLERDHRALTVPRGFQQPLDDLARRVGGPSRCGMLGGFNALPESLVRWRAWHLKRREASLAPPLRGLDGDSDPEEILERLRSWRDRHELQRIVALRPIAGSAWLADADFRRYNAWQLEAIRLALERLSYRRRALRSYPPLGVEVFTLDRRRSRNASGPRWKRLVRGHGSGSPNRR